MAAVLLAFMRDNASTIFSDHLQSICLIKDIRFHSIPPNFWAARSMWLAALLDENTSFSLKRIPTLQRLPFRSHCEPLHSTLEKRVNVPS